MHIRPFLISGLLVGAALFLPGNAFAEKNVPSGQQNPHQAETPVKTDHPVGQSVKRANVDNVKSARPTVVIPESASKIQGGIDRQAASDKPDAVPKELPVQAKGNGHSASKKPEKADIASGSAPSGNAQKSMPELENKPTPPKKGSGNPIDDTVKNSTQSANPAPEGLKEESHLLIANKPHVPETPEKKKVPAGKEEMPALSEMISPTQRTNHSGGPSTDRFSNGLNTISMLDKWFEWNKYDGINLVQPYLSWYALRNSQWVNAPPSPPPQETPFIETVTRS